LKKLNEMIKKDDIQKEIFEMETLKGEVDDDNNVPEEENGNGNGNGNGKEPD